MVGHVRWRCSVRRVINVVAISCFGGLGSRPTIPEEGRVNPDYDFTPTTRRDRRSRRQVEEGCPRLRVKFLFGSVVFPLS